MLKKFSWANYTGLKADPEVVSREKYRFVGIKTKMSDKLDREIKYKEACSFWRHGAEERCRTLNMYFVLLLGLILALNWAIDKGPFCVRIIAAIAIMMTFAFSVMEWKNRILYRVAADCTKSLEKLKLTDFIYPSHKLDKPARATWSNYFKDFQENISRIYKSFLFPIYSQLNKFVLFEILFILFRILIDLLITVSGLIMSILILLKLYNKATEGNKSEVIENSGLEVAESNKTDEPTFLSISMAMDIVYLLTLVFWFLILLFPPTMNDLSYKTKCDELFVKNSQEFITAIAECLSEIDLQDSKLAYMQKYEYDRQLDIKLQEVHKLKYELIIMLDDSCVEIKEKITEVVDAIIAIKDKKENNIEELNKKIKLFNHAVQDAY